MGEERLRRVLTMLQPAISAVSLYTSDYRPYLAVGYLDPVIVSDVLRGGGN